MSTLSIFIDESGDFGKFALHCPYYIVSIIFHEQTKNISEQVNILNEHLEELGYKHHTIHTAPLIRKEGDYKNIDIKTRYKIFSKLFYFLKNVDVKFSNLVVRKKQTGKQEEIENQLSIQLSELLKNNLAYFLRFSEIIVYYDNGQIQLSKILETIFKNNLGDCIEFRQVMPSNYKLFQAADLICTLTLLKTKLQNTKKLTKYENVFFRGKNNLKKNFLNYLDKIKIINTK